MSKEEYPLVFAATLPGYTNKPLPLERVKGAFAGFPGQNQLPEGGAGALLRGRYSTLYNSRRPSLTRS